MVLTPPEIVEDGTVSFFFRCVDLYEVYSPFFFFTGFSVSTTMATIKSLVRMKLHLFSSTHFCFRFLSIRLELSCDIGFIFILTKQLLKLGRKLDKDGQKLLLSPGWL